jgi:hypothetical protein
LVLHDGRRRADEAQPDLMARIARIALDMHLDLPKILGG